MVQLDGFKQMADPICYLHPQVPGGVEIYSS